MKRVLLIPLSIPGVKVMPLAIPGVKLTPLSIPGVEVTPLSIPGVKVGVNCIDELIVQIFKLFTFTSGPDVKSIGELNRHRFVSAPLG